MTKNKKEYNTPYQRQRRKDYPLKVMLARAKHRAKRDGVEFAIEETDLLLPVWCPILGVKLKIGHPDNAPSLDRIDPNIGYIPSNVQICSVRINRIKNNATLDELRMLVSWMEQLEKYRKT